MSRYPWMKFYPDDWARDLRRVPLASRGLWIDLICEMWHSPERGVLLHANGRIVEDHQIGTIVGETPGSIRRALDGLEGVGILSRREDGAILCRRMVREEQSRSGERERKRKERGSSKDCPPVVRDLSAGSHGVEARSQTRPEARSQKPDQNGEAAPLGSGRVAGRETEGWLVAYGINRVVAAHLERGGVTVHDCQEAATSIKQDKSIRRPQAVLVHRLCELRNITLPKGPKVDPAFRAFQERLDRRRG